MTVLKSAERVRRTATTAKQRASRAQRPTGNTGKNSGGVRNLRPWKPGQSGNPRGRPPVPPELRELARAHTTAAIEALVEIMKDRSAGASARVSAANALLDRAHGRPPTEIELRAGGLPGAPPIATARIDVSRLTAQQQYEYVISGGDPAFLVPIETHEVKPNDAP